MKTSSKTIFASLSLALSLASAQAASLVLIYDIDGDVSGSTVAFDTTTSSLPTGSSASVLSLADNGGFGTQSRSSDLKLKLSNNNDANGNSILFSITVAPGFQFTVTEFSLWHARSSSGTGEFLVNSNSGGTFTPETGTSESSSSSNFTGLTQPLTGTVNFGVNFSGFQFSGNNVELDDITVRGDILPVPEPSAGILGAIGCLALLRRRR